MFLLFSINCRADCVCGNINLVSNGDFESSQGKLSGVSYKYTPPCPEPWGSYSIVSNPKTCNYLWYATDHTYQDTANYYKYPNPNSAPQGHFLLIDPNDKAGVCYQTKLSVNTNTCYKFSFWAKDMNSIPSQYSPIIGVSVNGAQYGSCDTIYSTTSFTYDVAGNVTVYNAGKWENISGCWCSGTSKTLTFEIFYCVAGEAGNDLGIDDIVISECQEALPICLLDFSAELNFNKVRVKWSTASQINCAKFEVFRSAEGEVFKQLAEFPGEGNYIGTLFYTYLDEHPLIGDNYYLLREVDYDGQVTMSDPVHVYASEIGQYNPFLHYNLLGQIISK